MIPAPSHTPGPTPTNPPGEEAALRQALAVALQSRNHLNIDTTTYRIGVNSVRIEGDWAYLGIHLERLDGTKVPAGGGLALGRKVDGQWQLAFRGEPEYSRWLVALPNSLLTPQQRQGLQ
jgi:hypothetical protein